MQNLAKIIEKRIADASDDLHEYAEYESLTTDERIAILEAEHLADTYADVTPNLTTISDSYLFRLSHSS